jgi:hypothetical protein
LELHNLLPSRLKIGNIELERICNSKGWTSKEYVEGLKEYYEEQNRQHYEYIRRRYSQRIEKDSGKGDV